MKNLIFILICISFFSCSGINHCLKIGGEYEGIKGDVEWCFSEKESTAAGAPVLKTPEETQALVILNEEQVVKINALIDQKEMKIMKDGTLPPKNNSIKRLIDGLKRLK